MLQPHQLAGRALERAVRRIPIRPLDQHDFALDPSVDGGRRDCRRRGVAGQVETSDDAGLRRGGRVSCRVLHVKRVEHAVLRVVGIEDEVGETGGEVALEGELREQARPSAAAVEIQVGREGLRLLVEDVERPVEIVDEEAAAARLVAQEVDARELRARVVVRVVGGDRQRGIVLQLQRQPRRRAAAAAKGRTTARASKQRCRSEGRGRSSLLLTAPLADALVDPLAGSDRRSAGGSCPA